MPVYKYINRYYLLWSIFLSLLVSICLIINGAVPWQTTILEMSLVKTKRWQMNMGVFICLLCVMGFVALEAGSKGLSWLYVFCTIALALVAFVHALIDMTNEPDALARTEYLLKLYYKNYEKVTYTDDVDNFQQRMRCCGLHDKKEMIRGKKCFYVRSCCHWKINECTIKEVFKETCYKKANHVIHLSRLCAALGIIAGSVQLLVLLVLLCGGLKYVYHLIFPPAGPIVND